MPLPACSYWSGCCAGLLAARVQVQLEPIRRVSGGAAGQLAPKYTGMLQAVRTIVREEGFLVNTAVPAPFCPSSLAPGTAPGFCTLSGNGWTPILIISYQRCHAAQTNFHSSNPAELTACFQLRCPCKCC